MSGSEPDSLGKLSPLEHTLEHTPLEHTPLEHAVLLAESPAGQGGGLYEILSREFQYVDRVDSIDGAASIAEERAPSLVFLDAPREDTLDWCRQLRAAASLAHVPIIVVVPSGLDARKVVEVGAADTLVVPCSSPQIRGRAFAHLQLPWAEIRQLKAELEAADRDREEERAVIQVLLRAIAHDIRSPLTSIVATLAFLQEDVGDALPPENAEDVRQARIAASRLTEIARDVLDLARLEGEVDAMREGGASIGTILDAVRQAVVAENGRVQMNFLVDDPRCVVACDRDLLRRVLVNLVRNAERHAPPETLVEVRSRTTNTAVRIEVSDEGPGLSEDAQRRMFERYGPLKLKLLGLGRSTGLGLEFARVAVAALGGRIGVRSSGSTGACTWVEIPRKGEASA